jgi:hypothetical protein
MPIDAKSAAIALANLRSIILFVLGYVSCVGVMILLNKAYAKRRRLVAPILMGTLVWILLLAYPTLLWIPISLFLVIAMGSAA